MKLDLNFELENIELLNLPKDAELSDDAKHLGRILAGVLAKATESENPVKFLDWALDLYKKKPIEIDKSDTEMLRRFIKNHKQLFVIAQAQILSKIDDLKENKEN